LESSTSGIKSEYGLSIKERIADIVEPYRGQKGILISVLQAVQDRLGYLPDEAISEVSRVLNIPVSEVFGVASFYALFRFERSGQYLVRVCQGTACHVRGGKRILETVKNELGISPGETTPDYKFSLERVACFGSCALAPVMVINKSVYGRMTTGKAKKILEEYRSK
jgi:NADH-quinone oxidoreductase subunit E